MVHLVLSHYSLFFSESRQENILKCKHFFPIFFFTMFKGSGSSRIVPRKARRLLSPRKLLELQTVGLDSRLWRAEILGMEHRDLCV